MVPGDTIYSRKRLHIRPRNSFVLARHPRGGQGYIRNTGQTFLYTVSYHPFSTQPRYATVSGGYMAPLYTGSSYSSSTDLDMSRPVHVRSYSRRTKSGKTVQVRAHTRSLPGTRSSSSSSRSYRNSGSSYRSSGSSYRSSGGGSRGRR